MRRRCVVASATAAGLVLAAAAAGAALAPAANAAGQKHRYLVVARSAADLGTVKNIAANAGATVIPGPGTTVTAVQATDAQAAALDASAATTTVVRDRRVSLVEPEAVATKAPTGLDRRSVGGRGWGSTGKQDPPTRCPA